MTDYFCKLYNCKDKGYNKLIRLIVIGLGVVLVLAFSVCYYIFQYSVVIEEIKNGVVGHDSDSCPCFTVPE